MEQFYDAVLKTCLKQVLFINQTPKRAFSFFPLSVPDSERLNMLLV